MLDRANYDLNVALGIKLAELSAGDVKFPISLDVALRYFRVPQIQEDWQFQVSTLLTMSAVIAESAAK